MSMVALSRLHMILLVAFTERLVFKQPEVAADLVNDVSDEFHPYVLEAG